MSIPKKRKPKEKAPSQAVFEDIIEQFSDAMSPLLRKVARNRQKDQTEFCCVIGPSGDENTDGQKFTMSAQEATSVIERIRKLDPAVAEKLNAPLDRHNARVVVFFKGVVFVKDVFLIPPQNSRGGSA